MGGGDKKTPDNKHLRYVDDIIVFVNHKHNPQWIQKQVIEQLNREFRLEINEEKSDQDIKDKGYYKIEVDNEFYKSIQEQVSYVLNSVYIGVAREINKIGVELKEDSIQKVREQLKKLGIDLPMNEFAYGIRRNIKTIHTSKDVIGNEQDTVTWLNEKVANLYSDWSGIFEENENWYNNFIKRKRNNSFISELHTLKNIIKEGIDTIIRMPEKNDKVVKRIKYLYNRITIFESDLSFDAIQEILKINPTIDLKKLKGKKGIIDGFKEEIDYQMLESANLSKIWLLGEVRDEANRAILENAFRLTNNEQRKHINTIITEALLKQQYISDKLVNECIDKLCSEVELEYEILRNTIFIANCHEDMLKDKISQIQDIYASDIRKAKLLEWIQKNMGVNILSLDEEQVDYTLGDEYGEGYEFLKYIDEYIS